MRRGIGALVAISLISVAATVRAERQEKALFAQTPGETVTNHHFGSRGTSMGMHNRKVREKRLARNRQARRSRIANGRKR